MQKTVYLDDDVHQYILKVGKLRGIKNYSSIVNTLLREAMGKADNSIVYDAQEELLREMLKIVEDRRNSIVTEKADKKSEEARLAELRQRGIAWADAWIKARANRIYGLTSEENQELAKPFFVDVSPDEVTLICQTARTRCGSLLKGRQANSEFNNFVKEVELRLVGA